MARGGKRAGAGRKLGSATKRTRAIADKACSGGLTPLEIMLGAAQAAWVDAQGDGGKVDILKAKIAADIAKDAAPYIHPRLASVEHKGSDDGPIQIILSAADAAL